jgi:hypothetical protein
MKAQFVDPWNRQLPVSSYKTYAIRSPIQTHYRKATCEEIGCEAFQNGWAYLKEDLTPGDLYLATHSGKRYREVHIGPGQNYIVFEAGQSCFGAAQHVISLHRPEFYFVGRGHTSVFQARHARAHANGDDFVDDFANHQDKLNTTFKRG